MSNWFVFFVRTGKEQVVCNYFNERLNNKGLAAFFPKVQLVYKTSKQVRKELKPMFPGYVFAETDLDARSIAIQTSQMVRTSKHLFKLLGNENSDYMPLHEEEKAFLLKFCDEAYIVRESKGLKKGDKVFVTSGPLQGRESIIKRIDRHKRRAEIELGFMGDVRRVRLSLEIVERV